MMNQRCHNEKQVAFERYGGRSIAVCERWQNSFVTFLEDMGERPEGMSLDRIDNNGDYCPENCRWATPVEQANNTRKTRRVVVDGEVRLARDVARENGVTPQSIGQRINKGWSLEQAVGLVDHYDPRAVTIDGETMTMAGWATKLGITRQAMEQRIRNGWDIKEALTTPKVDFSQRRGLPTGPRAKKRGSMLGDFVNSERLRRGLTQHQLADCSDMTASTISNIETGKLVNPSWYILEKLAHSLDVQTEDIVRLLPDKGIDAIQYKWYDEFWKGGVQMNNDERERATWLQVRMTEEEKALLSELSIEYGLSISAFVRMMIAHFDEKRPTVSIRFGPKAEAPVAEMAGMV